jgi:DNA-binding transcriptional LysR family regulator
MLAKGVTLRGLEVFEALAKSGSVAQAAAATGLSQPAVSQQVRNLEKALGTDLVDHGRRPMRLTPAGQSFLTRTETVLAQLRLAQSELTVMDLSHLSTLSIGLIDDFDNELTPRLATILAESLTNSRFKLITASSHEISAALLDREVQIAIAASTGEQREGIKEMPLARDPFILVAPRGHVTDKDDLLGSLADLPFLRYAREQLIGKQIETHLAGLGLTFEERFEIGSNPALMAMVARRIGWAITTPLGYLRATRVLEDVDAFELPFTQFARQISLFAGADWASGVPRDVATATRRLLESHFVEPGVARLPWLAGQLQIIEP